MSITECPGPLKSSEPVHILTAVVIEVEGDAHQCDLIINVVVIVLFQQHGEVDAMDGEIDGCW